MDDTNSTPDRGRFASLLLGRVEAKNKSAEYRIDRKHKQRQIKRQESDEDRARSRERWADRWQSTKSLAVTLFRALVVVGPILAPMAVAWTGQAGFAMKFIGWNLAGGVLYAAAYELTTVFCAWMAHEARRDGDRGTEYRLATWSFAAGASAQQWWHYSPDWSPTPLSVTFASMTLIGLILWELFARLLYRRKLRADGKLAKARPRIGLVRWVRYPQTSWDAWSISILKGYETLDQSWTEAEKLRTKRQKERTAQANERTSSDRTRSWRIFSRTSSDQAGPAPISPGPEQPETPDQLGPTPDLKEIEAGPTPDPELDNPGPGRTDQDTKSETVTALEAEAVRNLVERGDRLNRANVAEEVRALNGQIATKRAAEVAAWGREQDDTQLKAV